MAFNQQKHKTGRVNVDVDFPELPQPPLMTMHQDREAVQQYHQALAQWYHGFKQSILDKFEALAAEIQSLKT